MSDKRKAGILCPVFSLSSKYGIGSFGESAYEFVRFLKKSSQTYWQILPLVPISSDGNSPYLSPSTFAGNYMYIDVDKLIDDGLLLESDVRGYKFEDDFVDYDYVAKAKDEILRKAFENNKVLKIIDTENFSERELVRGFCLFEALKKYFSGKSWLEFPDDIKYCKKKSVDYYEKLLASEIEYNAFVQALFYKQYFELKNYANDLGIKIFGDLPIYVSKESSDMWQNPEMFVVNEDLSPKLVAGVPPDRFSETGQYWGNPVYDWDCCEKTGFDWWLKRLKHNLKMYDVLRLDHFRGFEAFWAIVASESTAENGHWIKAKGDEFFEILKKKNLIDRVVAEDLGLITDDVINLRDRFGFKGMKVMQFAFDVNEESDYLPHNVGENCVYYTGTHDNQTLRGFVNSRSSDELDYIKDYVNATNVELSMIKAAYMTNSCLCMCQMQDFLGLDDDYRTNTPNTLGNWTWRMKKDWLTDKLAEKISAITKLYNRD
ncbi:MAG: 4-alpha-glucanotransferase [Finegoldia magna]|uniref:4-alpha-glucanotransferase n=1 Tax=Finegoldia magna TaxID=1260 RepID=UPI00242E7FFB|nr:4-alpha-glucanotransferase [Finegoldia magna]MBS5971783.1 4-alpha-glucanotransferase [Finegoldia magna]